MISLLNENSNRPASSKNKPNPTNFSNLKSQHYLAIEFHSIDKNVSNTKNPFQSTSKIKNSNYISERNHIDERVGTGRELFPQTTKTPMQLNKILNSKKMSLDIQNRTPQTCPISKNSKIEKIPPKSIDNLEEGRIDSSDCTNQSIRESENIQETDRPKINQEEIKLTNQNNHKKPKSSKVIKSNQHSNANKDSNKENKVKEKFKINLEDTLYAEDKLWSILEGLQTGEDVLTYCREWWALMKNEGISSVEVI